MQPPTPLVKDIEQMSDAHDLALTDTSSGCMGLHPPLQHQGLLDILALRLKLREMRSQTAGEKEV